MANCLKQCFWQPHTNIDKMHVKSAFSSNFYWLEIYRKGKRGEKGEAKQSFWFVFIFLNFPIKKKKQIEEAIFFVLGFFSRPFLLFFYWHIRDYSVWPPLCCRTGAEQKSAQHFPLNHSGQFKPGRGERWGEGISEQSLKPVSQCVEMIMNKLLWRLLIDWQKNPKFPDSPGKRHRSIGGKELHSNCFQIGPGPALGLDRHHDPSVEHFRPFTDNGHQGPQPIGRFDLTVVDLIRFGL